MDVDKTTLDFAELAKVAYKAYGESTGGVNYQGLPMPEWIDLPNKIKDAWIAAVREILKVAYGK